MLSCTTVGERGPPLPAFNIRPPLTSCYIFPHWVSIKTQASVSMCCNHAMTSSKFRHKVNLKWKKKCVCHCFWEIVFFPKFPLKQHKLIHLHVPLVFSHTLGSVWLTLHFFFTFWNRYVNHKLPNTMHWETSKAFCMTAVISTQRQMRSTIKMQKKRIWQVPLGSSAEADHGVLLVLQCLEEWMDEFRFRAKWI